jgi:hypothetical protein
VDFSAFSTRAARFLSGAQVERAGYRVEHRFRGTSLRVDAARLKLNIRRTDFARTQPFLDRGPDQGRVDRVGQP